VEVKHVSRIPQPFQMHRTRFIKKLGFIKKKKLFLLSSTTTSLEESTRLTYTGLIGELEHLKIKTRLIDEKFASVMGECVI
jgi:hypothetical protein